MRFSIPPIVIVLLAVVAAQSAFILMATREYIQDLLRLSDVEVIRGRRH